MKRKILCCLAVLAGCGLLRAQGGLARLRRADDGAGGRRLRIRTSYLYSTPGEHGALALVQRQYAAKMREKVPAGRGVWVQSEEGVWQQK